MDLYRPQNDGFAAGAGFRNNDIIRGLEECTLILKNDHSSSSSSNRASNTEGDVLVHRRLVNVDGISGERWRLVASSCEQFAPSTPLRMIVERRR